VSVAICLVSWVGSPNVLVMPHPSEVSALSRRGYCTPYPRHYGAAFACSDLPYPHRYRSALQLSYPWVRGPGRRYGLPMFRWKDNEGFRFSRFAGSGRGP
jgi:hypothetical protein